jgi:hypothetical protein
LEFPAFVQLAEEFADNDSVAVISVSCSGGPEFDIPDLRNKTLEFLAQHQSNMPTYADSAAMTRNQLALLLPHGSLSYPTTLLINREGVIIEAMEGYLAGEMEELAEKIKALL